jgi:hypothetical protein
MRPADESINIPGKIKISVPVRITRMKEQMYTIREWSLFMGGGWVGKWRK